jgi:hypothetical protein
MAASSRNSTLKRNLLNKYRFRAAKQWKGRNEEALNKGCLDIDEREMDAMYDENMGDDLAIEIISDAYRKQKDRDKATAYIENQKNHVTKLYGSSAQHATNSPQISVVNSMGGIDSDWISNDSIETIQSIILSLEGDNLNDEDDVDDDIEDIMETSDGVENNDIDINPPDSLGHDQKAAFTYILQNVKSRLNGDTSESLNLITHGGPGSGKSFLSSALYQRLKDHNCDMLCTATTGMASSVLKNGRTIHSLLHINESSMSKDKKSNRSLKKLTTAQLHKCQIMFKKCKLLLIDETSMLDPVLLYHINFRLRQIKGCDEDFGGLPILLVGDFFSYLRF